MYKTQTSQPAKSKQVTVLLQTEFFCQHKEKKKTKKGQKVDRTNRVQKCLFRAFNEIGFLLPKRYRMQERE